MPHLGSPARSFTFDYARGTGLHDAVSAAGWKYEPDVMATLLSCLSQEPGAVFVDVGANIGYFPIVVKGLLGNEVTCVAYEPTPNLAARIRRGARENHVEFEVKDVAVGAHVGTSRFFLSARSDASNSLNSAFRRHRGEIDVNVTTIDSDHRDWLPHRAQARPLLLIDVETMEPDVLEGARNFIAEFRPAIVCEVLAGRTEDAIQSIVDSLGYTAFALTNNGIESRDRIVGDSTYQHRDWLFWPAESSPPAGLIAATLRSLTG